MALLLFFSLGTLTDVSVELEQLSRQAIDETTWVMELRATATARGINPEDGSPFEEVQDSHTYFVIATDAGIGPLVGADEGSCELPLSPAGEALRSSVADSLGVEAVVVSEWTVAD